MYKGFFIFDSLTPIIFSVCVGKAMLFTFFSWLYHFFVLILRDIDNRNNGDYILLLYK